MRPGLPGDKVGGDIREKILRSDATRWERIKFRLGLVLEGWSKLSGGGGLPGGGWTMPVFINPQAICELDPSFHFCLPYRKGQVF
jgi:hypothetical protein